jgi:hypothetical protein
MLLPNTPLRIISYECSDGSTAEQRPVVKATMADGVLRITRVLRQTATYRVKGNAASPQLIVEHPRHAGFRLTTPDPGGVDMTAGAYRIPVNRGGLGNLDRGLRGFSA